MDLIFGTELNPMISYQRDGWRTDTIQMQQCEHLRYERDINKRAEIRDQRLPRHTSGGTSATEPSMSQMTPLQKKKN
jgi:hypothetical protein